jgi:hypothetical protein
MPGTHPPWAPLPVPRDEEWSFNPRFWFQVDAERDPPSSFPLAGRGLLTGADAPPEAA